MTDYATLSQLKARTRVLFSDFKGLTTGEFDTLAGLLLGDASRAMEHFCSRDWALHDETTSGRVFSVGPSFERIIPIDGPVISITSVETRDGPGGTWSTMDSDTYTYVNFPAFNPTPEGNIAHLKRTGFGMYEQGRQTRYNVYSRGSTRYMRSRQTFWRSYDSVRVKYTWGYTTIPGEVTRICIGIVDDWLKKMLKDEVGKRVKATTPEDLQMIMRYEIPAHLRKSLKAWSSGGGIRAV